MPRSAETRAAELPLVGILNFYHNDFGENIAECQCYVVVTDNVNNPLRHNVWHPNHEVCNTSEHNMQYKNYALDHSSIYANTIFIIIMVI